MAEIFTHVMYAFTTLSYSFEYDTWYLDSIDPNADFLWKPESSSPCMEFLTDVQCGEGRVSLVPYLGAGAREQRCPVSRCFNAGGSVHNPRQCHTELFLPSRQVCGQIHHVLNQLPDFTNTTSVLLTIGGWYDANYWTKAVSPTYVEKFITSIVSWIQALPFDGVDINWEHPGFEHEGQPSPSRTFDKSKTGNPDVIRNCRTEPCEEDRSKDARFFAIFLKKLKHRLSKAGPNRDGLNRHGKPYELSIAVTGVPSIVADWPLSKICEIVDRVNLMTYDYYGGWSPRTGHQSALYGSSCEERNVECTVKFWLEKGCPRHKLILGIPTYARVMKNVPVGANPNQPGYRQGHSGSQAERVVSTQTVLKDPSFKPYWDALAHASFSYSASRKEFASYDNEQSIQAKARFVNEWGLGGMMAWKMGSDDPEDRVLEYMKRYLR